MQCNACNECARAQNIPVSRDLEDALMLLHSYVLVKLLVKQGDHDTVRQVYRRL